MTSDYTSQWAGSATIGHVFLSTGGRLRYLKSGSGPPLLLMHTLRTQLDYFQRLIPLLTSRFTVYAVDLPGLGWSDIQPGAAYDEPAVRRDLIEFIQHLALEDLTLAGDSMGATLALSIAADLGAKIRRVVAVNPYDYPQGVERANPLASLLVKMMRVPGIGLVPAILENELILGGILSGGFHDPRKLPKDLVKELIRSGRRAGYPRVETAYLRSLKSYMAARRLYGRIRSPVTLVYGADDWSRPSEREAVGRLVAGSRMLFLPDAGHFVSLEHPGEVASIILNTPPEP